MRRAIVAAALLAAIAGCGEEKKVQIIATESLALNGDLRGFETARELQPPRIAIREPAGAKTSNGFMFVTPRASKPTQATGPMILDSKGRLVWFHPVKGRSFVNLNVQRYKGRPVLTWSERPPITSPDDLYRGDPAALFNVIVDQRYKEIRKVRAVGDGVRTDLHDLVITKGGRALVLGFKNVAGVIDCYVQEIDLETGKVLLNWSALDHVPTSESEVPRPKTGPWDYFHHNSIAEDSDGNLLMSARHTSTIYKLDRRTGKILWRLGGKHSDFEMGAGTRFRYQHDAQRLPNGHLSLFDNAATEFDKAAKESAVLEIKLDEHAKRATLVKAIKHAKPLLAASQGSARRLPNGNVFVGWGNAPYFSEYTPDGKQVLDAALPSAAYQSYRAFKGAWSATPATKPQLKTLLGADNTVIYVSWNGATDVARWRVLGGSGRDALEELGSVEWKGLETRISVGAKPAFVQLEAVDKSGEVLGRSAVVRV